MHRNPKNSENNPSVLENSHRLPCWVESPILSRPPAKHHQVGSQSRPYLPKGSVTAASHGAELQLAYLRQTYAEPCH